MKQDNSSIQPYRGEAVIRTVFYRSLGVILVIALGGAGLWAIKSVRLPPFEKSQENN